MDDAAHPRSPEARAPRGAVNPRSPEARAPRGAREDVVQRATYWAYRCGALAANALPEPVSAATARGIGRALSYAMPARRRMSARHLQRASGGELRGIALERSVNQAFDSYARYWVEMFRLPHAQREEIISNFKIDGYEHVEAALARGNGAIFALPHLGGWEFAGAWMSAAKRQRLLVVVEALEPIELFDWFVEIRNAMGMEVVAAGADTAQRCLQALRENRIVCLLSDRDLSGGGIDVSFFGESTKLPAGPAMLALRADSVVLPVAVYFGKGRKHSAIVRPALDMQRHGKLRQDIERITQALADEFELLIGAAPQQWHLMQPNWPSDYELGPRPTIWNAP